MKEPYFITNSSADLRPYMDMKVTLTDYYGKQVIGFPINTPQVSKIRYFVFSYLVKLTVWFLLKCMRYPIVSLADKLNGHGFVIVPIDQWVQRTTIDSFSLKQVVPPPGAGFEWTPAKDSGFDYNKPG